MIVGCTATVEAPEGESDSGYNQKRQLLQQGIEVVLKASDPGSLTGAGTAGWGGRGVRPVARSRARSICPWGPIARVNEVLQGVVMGDTVGIDEGWLEAFRRSGTAHMLSVSGLHVASLAAIMIGLARLLRAPRWVGFALAAASAVLMVPFVGPSPPIIRSAVMIVVVLLGRWVGRGRDQWQILALAAVVILAMNPFAVFDVGFQLSFAAFVGMMALGAPLQKLLKRLPRVIAADIAVSLAAGAGTAPVALVQFGKTSLISPLANLLVVPTLPVVTGLGMASVFAGFIWHGLSVALDTLASLPMMWTVLVSELMAIAPVLGSGGSGAGAGGGRGGRRPAPGRSGPVRTLGESAVRPAAAVLQALAALAAEAPAAAAAPRPRWGRGAGGVRAGAGLRGLPGRGARAAEPCRRRSADVRGRTAWRCGCSMWGRATPCWCAHRSITPCCSTAVRRTATWRGQLRSLGVRRLDVVVISHPHADHFAGLLQSLDGVEVATLVDNVQVGAALRGRRRRKRCGGGGSRGATPGRRQPRGTRLGSTSNCGAC